MTLFVYGSLLRGEQNHAEIVIARFLGEARTAPRCTLVSLGPYPALLLEGDTAVLGELYDVPDALVPFLDEFEGHPDLYVRETIELSDGRLVQAYVMPADRAAGGTCIPSGSWRAR